MLNIPSYLGQGWKKVLLILLIELLALQPFLVVGASQIAQAADTTTSQYHDDQDCWNKVDREYNPSSTAPAGTSSSGVAPSDIDPMASPEDHIRQSFNITAIKSDTSIPQARRDAVTNRDYIDQVVQYYHIGITYYKAPAKATAIQPGSEWVFVCDTATSTVSPLVFSTTTTFTPNVQDFLETLYNPNPKLAFKNLADKYAVLGEPCAGGFTIPYDQWRVGGPNPCPAPNFRPEDDFFPNGVWDAPKVDPRVIETLDYLLTPAEQGGAGREFLRVKKVIQFNANNPFNTPVQVDDSTSGGGTDTSPTDDPNTTNPSSFYIPPGDSPFLPEHVSGSIQIDQIDKVRVSTKIVEHRLFGNNTTTYKFQPAFPVDVAWQTDAGQAQNPPPDFSQLSMLESSRVLTNAAIIQLLNQYGLGDLEIDPSATEVNDFGDVALLVGQSLLEQLLGSPKGSLKGWDLISTLRSIGLAYLEQDMGLVPGALADTNPLDNLNTTADFSDIAGSIGRSTVEYVLGFPRGSLRTATGKSADILENVGRRYLENQVFKVSENTMVPSDGFPMNNIGDLLARLGEGRIEAVFKLPKQSLRTNDYNGFRTSSYKATLLFPEKKSEAAATQDDYDMADYVSNQLNLAYVPYNYVPTDDQGHPNGSVSTATTNMYGFSEGDFHFPSLVMASTDLQRFKQLVGSKVIENSLGMFRREGVAKRLPSQQDGAPVADITANGVHLLAQNRPINDGTTGINNRTGYWCDSSALAYTFKDAYFSLKADNFDEMITRLESDNFPSWGAGIYDHKCDKKGEVVSQTSDLDIMGNVQSTLFNTTPEKRLVFLNQDKAPKITDFNGTNHLDRRFNTALLLFYNKPENYQEITLNTISPSTTGDLSVPSGSGTVSIPSDASVTLADVLKELEDGSPASSGGFHFSSDSGLRDRLTMIQNKYNADKSSNFFDLTPLKDLPSNQLDNALIDRLNELSVKPKASAYAQEYNQADLNGWLFLIQDLQGRLNCKLTNGSWQINQAGNAHTCVGNGNQQNTNSNSTLDQATQNKIQQAVVLIKRLLSSINTMGDTLASSLGSGGIVDSSGLEGQSMWSAGIGLDGQSFKMDDNFRFIKDSPQYNTDLMRLLLSPERNANGVVPLSANIQDFFTRGADGQSNISEVGKNYAATKFTTDPLAKRAFIAKLKTDFANVKELANETKSDFDKAVDDSKSYGIDESQFSDKGLANGDFQRIFMLDSSKSVFERVGKDELLRTVWQRSGAASAIKSSDQFQGLLRDAQNLVQTFDFYSSRIHDIQKKSDDLQKKLDQASGDAEFQAARDNLRAVNAKYKGKNTTSITYLQEWARAYEPILNILKDKSAKQNLRDISQDITQILHLAEEIAAGHALPQQQFGALDPNNGLFSNGNGSNSTSCFSKSDLITAFTGKGSLIGNLTKMGESVGGCQVDVAFGLPKGTMFNWYNLGLHQFPPDQINYDFSIDESDGTITYWVTSIDKVGEKNRHLFTASTDANGVTTYKAKVPIWNDKQWNLGNLKLAAAIAKHAEYGEHIDITNLQLMSVDEINALVTEGNKILDLTIVAKLIQMIPGIGSFARQYGLNSQDFVNIMTRGDLRSLTSKVGGAVLDNALNLQKGTSASIIFPQCHDNTGATAKCNKAPGQAGTDPDNVRMEILAGVGLHKLGLTVPNFPLYFSFNSGGNLLDNWGNAMISQALNLAPNSFKGTTALLASDDPDYTKKCTASPLTCQNTITTLMDAFGLSMTPAMQNLEKIRAQMVLTANKELGTLSQPDIDAFLVKMQDVFSQIEDSITFDPLRDPIRQNLGYWADRNNPDQLIVGERTGYVEGMQTLWDFVQNQKNSNGNPLFSQNSIALLRIAILNNQGELAKTGAVDTKDSVVFAADFPVSNLKDENTTIQALHNRYISYIGYFQDHLDHLNKQYNLRHDDAKPSNDQSFNGLLRGSYDASRITTAAGMAKTVSDILGNKLDQWINDSAPGWFKDINQAFKYITADPNVCGKEVGVGSFLANVITNGYDSNYNPISGNPSGSYCGIEGFHGIGSAELLYSTNPNYIKLRDLLFDKFLSHTFSSELEREIGFQQGTFRALMADPKHGDQILISQGVMMITDRIFGPDQHNDPCQYKVTPDATCLASTVKSSTRAAFMAGFYDTENKKFTLDFQSKRAVDTFNLQMNKALDNQLARIGKNYIGVEITRADFNMFIKGDERILAMLALQYAANRLNKSLFSSKSGRNPAAKNFVIQYADVRDAAGLPSQREIDQQTSLAQHDALVTNCQTSPGLEAEFCNYFSQDVLLSIYENRVQQEQLARINSYQHGNTDIDITQIAFADFNHDGVIDDSEVEQYKKNGLSLDSHVIALQELDQAGKNGLKQRLHDERIKAQESLKFSMLDIAAFSIDSNIPTHFSERLLGKDAGARFTALGQYAFNAVLSSNSSLGKTLQSICGGQANRDQCYTFMKDFGAAITAGKNMPTKLQDLFKNQNNQIFINAIDTEFNKWFKKNLDITLPPGVFKGVYAWAMTGFKNSAFNKDSLCFQGTGDACVGGFTAVPVGRIIEDWGIASVAKWADKQFGFKIGTAAKIIQAAQLIFTIQKLVQAGRVLKSQLEVAKALDNILGTTHLASDIAEKMTANSKAISALKSQLVILAGQIVAGLFNKALQNNDKVLGLPPGTLEIIVSAGVSAVIASLTRVALGGTFWVGVAIALGMDLIFGVTRVDITTVATGDGYYPFYKYGTGEAKGWKNKVYPEHVSQDAATGLFDPTRGITYRTGLKAVAQEKVTDLLHDLLMMPTSDWAANNQIDPNTLWIPQVFTYGGAEFNPRLDPRIVQLYNQPTPSTTGEQSPEDSAFGYGDLSAQCEDLTYNADADTYTCTRPDNRLSGFFPSPLMTDAIHIRF